MTIMQQSGNRKNRSVNGMAILFLGLTVFYIVESISAQECLQAAPLQPGGDRRNLTFRDVNSSPVLPGRQVQAIVTSYQFGCCGDITGWQTYFQHRSGNFDEDVTFQVWRPSLNVETTGCYSLVGESRYPSITLVNSGLFSAPLAESDMISVRPGDVVGYFTNICRKGNSKNGKYQGIQLDDQHDVDSVWYFSDSGGGSLVMQGGSCPFPVGTQNGAVLTSSTSLAPVLMVSISTYSCLPLRTTPSEIQITKSTYQPSTSTAEQATFLIHTSIPSIPQPYSFQSTSTFLTPTQPFSFYFLQSTSTPLFPTISLDTVTILVSQLPSRTSDINKQVPNATAALNTATVASIAAAGGVALLLTLLCSLALAISILKRKRSRETPAPRGLSTEVTQREESEYVNTGMLLSKITNGEELDTSVKLETNEAYDAAANVPVHANESYGTVTATDTNVMHESLNTTSPPVQENKDMTASGNCDKLYEEIVSTDPNVAYSSIHKENENEEYHYYY